MGKKITVHMFETADIVRSVIKGVEVTAVCGYVKIHTRDSIDSAVGLIDAGQARTCPACFRGFNNVEDDGEHVLHPSRGWLSMLEHVWEAQYDAGARKPTWTYRADGVWTWPLAG